MKDKTLRDTISYMSNAIFGEAFLSFDEDLGRWKMKGSDTSMTDEELGEMIVKNFQRVDVEREGDSEKDDGIYYQDIMIPTESLPCGCCTMCGCTCTEEEREIVRRGLS